MVFDPETKLHFCFGRFGGDFRRKVTKDQGPYHGVPNAGLIAVWLRPVLGASFR